MKKNHIFPVPVACKIRMTFTELQEDKPVHADLFYCFRKAMTATAHCQNAVVYFFKLSGRIL
jgi:hypothetical protein